MNQFKKFIVKYWKIFFYVINSTSSILKVNLLLDIKELNHINQNEIMQTSLKYYKAPKTYTKDYEKVYVKFIDATINLVYYCFKGRKKLYKDGNLFDAKPLLIQLIRVILRKKRLKIIKLNVVLLLIIMQLKVMHMLLYYFMVSSI